MRPKIDIFVNRETEIKTLRKLVKGKSRILLVGLRGYGKTSLLVKLLESLYKEKQIGIYVNCLRIYSGSDLLLEIKKDVDALDIPDGKSLAEKFKILAKSPLSPKDALDIVFQEIENLGIQVLVFDEISAMIQKFALQKPFRGMGGTRAIAEYLKSLIESCSFSLIFSDTSIDSLYTLFEDYTSPLFRVFDAKFLIEPLDINATLELTRKMLEKRNIQLEDDALLLISEFSGGVPQYIRMIASLPSKTMNQDEIISLINTDLEGGFLNEYFTALLEKFAWNEQEVLFAIAKGLERFNEIDKQVINAAQALESLVRKQLLIKVKKSRKEVRYFIRDKLFKTWLAIQETPRYRKISLRRAKLYSLGLEALTRELFLTLKSTIKIKDALGQELILTPMKSVERYEGALGETDLLAVSIDERTYVGEIFGGMKCKREKIDQLLKNIYISEKLGYKNIHGLLITYFDLPEETIRYAQELVAKGIKMYVLTYRHLKAISKKTNLRIW